MRCLAASRNLLFGLTILAMVGCDKEKKKADPTPALHQVLVQYFGNQIPSTFGATVSSRSTLPDGTQPDNIQSVAVSGNQVGSYSASVAEGRDFVVKASYLNRNTSGLPAPYDANFRVQISVDGQVRRNIGVTGIIGPGEAYPTISYAIRSTEW